MHLAIEQRLLSHWIPINGCFPTTIHTQRRRIANRRGCTTTASLLHRKKEELDPAGDSLVASVRNLGSQFLENKVGITGADGATSTVLPSGESLWMFGDTVEGPFKSIRGLDLTSLRSNTGAIVPRQDASRGITNFRFLSDESGKRPRQIIPFAADEDPAKHRLWAIHGAAVGQHVFLFYHRITLLDGVDVFMNFQLDGMGIARADVATYDFKRLTAPDGTHLFWKGEAPTFGVFVTRADDYVYLWGSLATGMHLARTRDEVDRRLGQLRISRRGANDRQPK